MNLKNILILIICITIFTIFLLLLFIHRKNYKIVLEHSEKIKTLIELNNSLVFEKTPERYPNGYICNSKKQLDKFSIDDYFLSLIDSDADYYKKILDAIENNITNYDNYIEEVKNLKTTADEKFCKSIGMSFEKFCKYETSIFNKYIEAKPQTDVTIYCKATYTSPQRRNSYSKEKNYNFNDSKIFYNKAIILKEQRTMQQNLIRIERAKMTDSLRYDILKRDNFRCQICGACANDGVKLHVDHIIPVSKGGLTEISNLRTLCDRCNLGKSDKM